MWPFRQKKSLDYILQIIKLGTKVSTELDNPNNSHILEFLTLLQNFDTLVFYKIKDETGSEDLLNMCLMVQSLSKDAIIEINTINKLEKAKQVIIKIFEIEKYINDIILLKVNSLDKYKIGKLIGQGGVGKCYSIKNNRNLVYLTKGTLNSGNYNKQISYFNELMYLQLR